jgi:hypothetical protein
MRAQPGIIYVLSTAGIGVFLCAGLCFADDPVQNGNAALQAAERLAWLRNWSLRCPTTGRPSWNSPHQVIAATLSLSKRSRITKKETPSTGPEK